MSSINVSLPENQAKQVDALVKMYGFANKTEFVRSMLRFVVNNPSVVQQASVHPFVPPHNTSAAQIVADFEKSEKYSPEFIADLKEGLESSDYFSK